MVFFSLYERYFAVFLLHMHYVQDTDTYKIDKQVFDQFANYGKKFRTYSFTYHLNSQHTSLHISLVKKVPEFIFK
jgi:hypothetical protein